MNIRLFKFDDHVIWVQIPQKGVYLFMGHPVHTTSLGHHIFSIVTPDFLVE